MANQVYIPEGFKEWGEYSEQMHRQGERASLAEQAINAGPVQIIPPARAEVGPVQIAKPLQARVGPVRVLPRKGEVGYKAPAPKAKGRKKADPAPIFEHEGLIERPGIAERDRLVSHRLYDPASGQEFIVPERGALGGTQVQAPEGMTQQQLHDFIQKRDPNLQARTPPPAPPPSVYKPMPKNAALTPLSTYSADIPPQFELTPQERFQLHKTEATREPPVPERQFIPGGGSMAAEEEFKRQLRAEQEQELLWRMGVGGQ